MASAAAFLLACALATLPSTAASSSANVSLTVTSATSITATGCSSAGMVDVLSLGTVLPNSPTRSPDCVLGFGSTNDSSMLQVSQQDGVGSAMWAPGGGALDTPGFGSPNGYVTAGGAGTQQFSMSVMQRDGSMVAVGNDNGDPLFVRYLPNGALDPTFDGPGAPGNGRFTLPGAWASAYRVAIDAQGRILAPLLDDGSQTAVVVRLLPSGALDTSFDGDGYSPVLDPSPSVDTPDAFTVGGDGSIAVGGCANGSCLAATDQWMWFARLRSDGTLDTNFSGDGIHTENWSGGMDAVSEVLFDDAGRLYVFGKASIFGALTLVARYTTAGVRDAAFNPSTTNGGVGYRYYPELVGGSTAAMLRAPTGQLLLVGTTDDNSYRVARIDATTGAYDASYGTSGIATVTIAASSNEFPSAATVDGAGRVTMAGTYNGVFGSDLLALVRVTSGGQADPTFDGDGVRTLDTAPGYLEWANELTPASDGRIAIATWADGVAGNDARLIMLDDGGSVTDYQGGVADWDTASSTSMFGVCLKGVGGSALSDWTVDATCPASDGAFWRPVPTAGSKAAHLTAAGAGTATFVFGLRPSNTQPPGAYEARVAFDVLAPTV